MHLPLSVFFIIKIYASALPVVVRLFLCLQTVSYTHLDDYESKKFIAKSENITVGELLDIWAEEELKTGTLSNGTVQNYLGAITNIKKHPISERKLKNVTSEHLQAFFEIGRASCRERV